MADLPAASDPASDQQMAAALDAALDAMQKGQPFDREAMLCRFPALASVLGALGDLFAPTSAGNGHAPLARLAPPPLIGPYRIERELGAGGFGVVYLGYDPDVKRRVAIKVLHPGRIDQPEALSRFQREAHATGRLSHPGIVRLFDYSRQGPPWFLVTEYVEGAEPRVWCQQRSATPEQIAELVAQIADAVEYAHQQGVCHRDLKPGNLLIDGDGKPHVLDFGLARLDAGNAVTLAAETAEGHILGSLPYMPPEQALGQSHTADGRSDVYSLGVILYELLTGRLPFQGPAHTLPLQVMEATPPPPRELNPALSRDVEAICLKALARRPEDRYARAADLANDLRAYTEGKPVVARRLSWLGQVARMLDRRHLETLRRGWAPLLLATGMAILLGSVLANQWELTLAQPWQGLAVMLTKTVQLVIMVLLAGWLWPISESESKKPSWRWADRSPSERQVLSLVPGYFGGHLVLLVVNQFRADPIPTAPVLALLGGMGFINLGATIWGWFYVWGAGFLLLAALCAASGPYGTSVLGVGWLVFFVVSSVHLYWAR